MFWVLLAAIPGVAVQIYFFSIGTLYQIILAILTALIAETITCYLRKQSIIRVLKNHSALVTALLLGVSVPPLASWWIIILGTTFSIIIAKQCFGGLGQNLFNPAMIGYVVVLISFPIQMTSWLPPKELQSFDINWLDSLLLILIDSTLEGITIDTLRTGIDGMSQATPLESFKTGFLTDVISNILQKPLIQGKITRIGWQWVNLAYLLGGLIMLNRRIITWHIPASILTVLALFSTMSGFLDHHDYSTPLIQMLSGSTMLGAFFIATDPVTASTTPKGRLIYGSLIGTLVWLIRVYGDYPDGIAFAVLLTNMIVPLLDYYTRPCKYKHNL